MLNNLHKPFMQLFLCRQFLKKVMRKNSILRGMGKCSVPMLYQKRKIENIERKEVKHIWN